MLKHSLAAGLLACAALTPAAFAQDAKQPQQQEQQRSAQSGSIDFIQAIESEQFRSTNLVGKTVHNEQDETIGDISDLILSRSGEVAGVIIGVGGFLGIGESEVAVPMNALSFVPDNAAMASAGSGNAGADAAPATGRSAANVEKQPGAANQPSGTSTQAALPNQNTEDQGSAQQNAAANAGQAKSDPAQSASAGASAGSGAASPSSNPGTSAQADSSAGSNASSGYSTATVADSSTAGASEEDWLANMKVVLNTTREDLTDAPKLGDEESGAARQ